VKANLTVAVCKKELILMQTTSVTSASPTSNTVAAVRPTVFSVLFAISFVHLLNDTIQSVVPAIFPIVKDSLDLSYTELGLIAFALNATASVLQPAIGLYSDIHPKPYILPLGMASSLFGVLGLAFATSFWMIMLSVTLIGIGSSIFHPESSRVAYLAAGARRGMAQSIFQVGGNGGQALAPIMTAMIFVPLGQFGAVWFTIVAGIAIVVQWFNARWYAQQLQLRPPVRREKASGRMKLNPIRRKKIILAICILVLLVSSKMAYIATITIFYPFYLMEHHGLTIENAQWFIFLFLIAGTIGTLLGGTLADLIGRRNVLWFSIFGAIPFALILPIANLFWSGVLCFIIGITIMSSGGVTVVYAQELMPGNIGAVSGLFFGLSFGMGGISAAVLGVIADWTSIPFVIQMCAIFPLLGLLTIFLPADRKLQEWAVEAEVIARE
jgi:FSR family fosmidomycin resistance protein-like MFS transporter